MVYLDSSALVKLVVAEPESAALQRYLRRTPDRASCTLARVEVLRSVRRHGAAALTRGRRLLQRLHLVHVDEDLLEATRKRLGVRFDFWVTADRVESYKPDLAHFEAARPYVGDPAGWLHVAQSLFHDHVPAKMLGMRTVWINRRQDQPGTGATPPARAMADLIFSDMTSFAEAALQA